MESEDITTFRHKDLSCMSFAVFREMRKNGELCDLTIQVQDRSLVAHRAVLAAGVPYFRSMFASNAEEAEQKQIALTHLDPSALESLINFAYSSIVPISAQNVFSLLQASQFLQLKQVREACVAFLSKRIDDNNVLLVRETAERFNIPSLIDRSNRYIRKNFEEFSKSDAFLTLPPAWIREIISKDDLNICNEELVLEAILRWVKVSPDERRSMLSKLLREVRMVFLPTDYLMDLVTSEELIRNSIHCRDLIDDVKNYHLSDDKWLFSKLRTVPRKCSDVRHELYGVVRNDASNISVHHCNFVNKTWLRISENDIPDGNLYYVTVLKEKMYIFLEKTIHAFHIKTHEWKVLESTHEKIEGAAIASHENNMSFFGSVATDFRQKVRCFGVQQNKWMKEGKMKMGRDFSAAASLHEFVYITGGYNSTHNRLNAVEKYNPATGQWSECASLLTARTSHSCTSMKRKIYACGGFNENGLSCSVEVYDPFTSQWNSIAPMRFARSNFSLVPYNDAILVIGGKMRSLNSAVDSESYDPECDHWKITFPVPLRFQAAVSVSTSRKRDSKAIAC